LVFAGLTTTPDRISSAIRARDFCAAMIPRFGENGWLIVSNACEWRPRRSSRE
jgi:hypothetical protein